MTKNILMKTNLLIALFLTTFFYQKTNAQAKIQFKFTPEHTMEKGKMYNSFPVVNVLNKKEIDIPIYEIKQVKNPNYLNLETKISKVKKDSIEDAKKINDYLKIQTNIKSFIESNKRFKEKKHLLKDAQLILNSINQNYFVYEDKEVNSYKKVDFFKMKLDKSTFYSHLKNVSDKVINQMPTNRFTKELKYLRSELNKTDPTIKKEEKTGVEKATIYEMGSELDLKNYNGTIEKYGAYTKIPNETQLKLYFQKGTLIPNETYNKYVNNYNELLMKVFEGKRRVESMKLRPKDNFDGILLYKDVETNELFQCKRITDYGIDMRIINFENKLKSKGYKLTPKGDDFTLTTPNGYKLTLTNDIYKNVENGNINYINQVVNSVKIFKAYASKHESKVRVLQNLNKEYTSRMVSGNLNTTFLNKFRNALEKEKKEHNALIELVGFKDNEINFFLHLSNQTMNNKLRITNIINKCSNRLN